MGVVPDLLEVEHSSLPFFLGEKTILSAMEEG